MTPEELKQFKKDDEEIFGRNRRLHELAVKFALRQSTEEEIEELNALRGESLSVALDEQIKKQAEGMIAALARKLKSLV